MWEFQDSNEISGISGHILKFQEFQDRAQAWGKERKGKDHSVSQSLWQLSYLLTNAEIKYGFKCGFKLSLKLGFRCITVSTIAKSEETLMLLIKVSKRLIISIIGHS